MPDPFNSDLEREIDDSYRAWVTVLKLTKYQQLMPDFFHLHTGTTSS